MTSIVRGNDFTLIIPLEQFKVEGGNKIVVPFYPEDAELSVYLINAISKTKVTYIVENDILKVRINGKSISNGIYGVEITVIKEETNMRSMSVGQFRIVESNDKADYPDAVEFGVDVHQLQSQLFVPFGENSGTGTSDYNQLANRPRINEVILSGDKTLAELGIQPKGNYITDSAYVHTDNNFTQTLKERLESLNNYDDAAIRASVKKLEQALDKLMNGDVNGVIDAFNEIETFLAGITESDSLTKMLSDLRTMMSNAIMSKCSVLESKIEDINLRTDLEVVADTERKCGKYRIGGMELDLYECTFKIEVLPATVSLEKEYTISDDPLGNKTYIAVRDLVLTDGNSFYSDNYQVSKIYVDEEYRTRLLIKCLQPLDATHYAYIVLKYVKFDGEKFELKIAGLSSADAASANLVFPLLKYGKKFVYSYTFDDCIVQAYGKAFNTINKKWVDDSRFYHVGQKRTTGSTPTKTLGYTDGLGVEKRFAFGVTIWPDSSNSQIDNFMKPTNKNVDGYYPHLVWNDAVPLIDFGNELYFHDINTGLYGTTVTGILAGLKAAQKITVDNTNGYGMKVMARPNGNNDYCAAARQYEDIMMMAVENKTDIGAEANISFNTDWDLKKVAQYRRYTESSPTVEQLMPRIDTAALSEDYPWIHDFSHGPAQFQYILDLFATLNDKYGKDGSDIVWFATLDEVYEYWFIRKFSTIRKTIESDGVRFTVFVPNLRYGRHRDFSLRLSGVSDLSSIKALLPTPANVYGFSSGKVGNDYLLNINLEEKLLAMANKYTDRYLLSGSVENREDALYFINQLRSELKEELLAKLSVTQTAPTLDGIRINGGSSETNTNSVFVVFSSADFFTHYKLSESSDLSSVPWIEGTSKTVPFVLSDGYGEKTIFAMLKNAFGDSAMKSASITYAYEEPTENVILNSVNINNGETSTTDTSVVIALSLSGNPTHYMISESSVFAGAGWQSYASGNIAFTLSSQVGYKTVYVKVKNATSESVVKSASIILESAPPVEQNSKTVACLHSSLSLEGYNGINVNNPQQALLDTSGNTYITYLRNDTAGDSLATRPGGSANFNPDETAGAPYPYDVYKNAVSVYEVGPVAEKHLYFSAKAGAYRVKIYANTKHGNLGDAGYRVYIVNGEEKIPDFEVKNNSANMLVWENVAPVDGKIKITIKCTKGWLVVPLNVIEFELLL